jgi:exopolysaccharide biosynthesis protein
MTIQRPKKTILVRVLTALLLIIISGTLYSLADRYLIEHVEIANVNTVVSAAAVTSPTAPQAATSQAAVSQPSGQSSASLADAAAATVISPTAGVPTQAVTADDWNYTSGSTSIAIRKVTTGSGNTKVTYFVADVTISDAAQLSSAFAKNSFGRNIIEYTSQIAQANNAIFAINGDYYGFRSDGIVIRNGVIYRDIPARTGLAFYSDGTMKIYDETKTTAQALLDAGVWNTLSFGPALIQNLVAASNLGVVEVDTNFGNHSIQGSNPRTGIGIISANHFVFVVVDGRSNGYSRGVTLVEFAQIFKDLGCTDAYNIDGGGSSTMYFMGRVVNNPLGQNKERGTSDILFIGS